MVCVPCESTVHMPCHKHAGCVLLVVFTPSHTCPVKTIYIHSPVSHTVRSTPQLNFGTTRPPTVMSVVNPTSYLLTGCLVCS